MTLRVDSATIEAVVDRARAEGRTLWIACVVDDPVVDDVLACPLSGFAAAGREDRFFWEQGDSGDLALAVGLADEIESAGVDRFADVRSWARDVAERVSWIGRPRPAACPSFFGGFGFEATSRGSEDWKAFPAARFVLPGLIVSRIDGVSNATLIVRVEPGVTASAVETALASRADVLASLTAVAPVDEAKPIDLSEAWGEGPEFRVEADRPHPVFCAQVEDALRAFDEGELEKVVLARSLSVAHGGPIDVPEFMGRLRATYPTCTLVAMGRGDDTFLAATPELLVRTRGAAVATAALADQAIDALDAHLAEQGVKW